MLDDLRLSSERYLTRTNRIAGIVNRMADLQQEEMPVLIAFMAHPETRVLAQRYTKQWGSLLSQLGEAMELWSGDVVEISREVGDLGKKTA